MNKGVAPPTSAAFISAFASSSCLGRKRRGQGIIRKQYKRVSVHQEHNVVTGKGDVQNCSITSNMLRRYCCRLHASDGIEHVFYEHDTTVVIHKQYFVVLFLRLTTVFVFVKDLHNNSEEAALGGYIKRRAFARTHCCVWVGLCLCKIQNIFISEIN